MFSNSNKKNTKKVSLGDFAAGAKSIESAKILEMITGGHADDCHVTTPPPSGGGSGGGISNAVCH